MIHFLPVAAEDSGAPPAEASARLASIRHALRLVDPWGGGPADDLSEEELALAWPAASDAAKRCFAKRSEATVGSASAGLETIVAVRSSGQQAHPASVELVAEIIRDGLADLAHLLRR